jgi:ferric-dicitrate binding protein FerR (iron transport regulator)
MDNRLAILLSAYLAGALTDPERVELLRLLEQEPLQLAGAMQQVEGEMVLPEDLALTEERIVRNVLARAAGASREAAGTSQDTGGAAQDSAGASTQAGTIVRLRRPRAWLWAAAALLLVGIGASLWRMSEKPRPAHIPDTAGLHDVDPGSDKAYLTLSDGSVVALDSSSGGVIARQGATAVVKLAGGQVVYRAGGATGAGGASQGATGGGTAGGAVAMNTMRTPRGGQYHLTLPDGTRVWLNAASSITYPVAFQGARRQVSISGEAYFEVAADKAPFIVDVAGKSSVEVLGTSFDVNSYPEENAIKTTLLDGRVKVSAPGGPFLTLRPGQQAQVRQVQGQPAPGARGQGAWAPGAPAQITLVAHADTDKETAWKNGVFNFDNVHLDDAMRQLARWYDIEVVYEKGIPDIQFEGEISRNVKLSDLLKVLSRAEVKFKIEEGHRLIVLP